MKRRLLVLVLALAFAGCSPRLRVDTARMKPIETIAPVTFIANRAVRAPVRQTADSFPDGPGTTSARDVFTAGVPAFVGALVRTERFKIVDPKTVQAAAAYKQFPELSGVNAGTMQLADGFRLVEPNDGEAIGKLLAELGADAALISYWRFTLERRERSGIGHELATPVARLRAFLVDRSGVVVADDEIEAYSDEVIGIYGSSYDATMLTPMFLDPIETCAVRLVADLSNARAKATE